MSEQTLDPGVFEVFTAWLSQLQVDLTETVQGVALRGARPVAIGVTNGATKRPTTSAGALVGFSVRNLSDADGALVRVLFHDGADADADVILSVALSPGESSRDWFGPGGISIFNGLFVEITGGTVEGSVYLRGVE